MGLFFYNKIGSIISIGDLPTTNIIEPFNTQRTWRGAMKRITANQYQTSERYYKLPKILFENEEDRNTQPILKRKVEKVTFLYHF